MGHSPSEGSDLSSDEYRSKTSHRPKFKHKKSFKLKRKKQLQKMGHQQQPLQQHKPIGIEPYSSITSDTDMLSASSSCKFLSLSLSLTPLFLTFILSKVFKWHKDFRYLYGISHAMYSWDRFSNRVWINCRNFRTSAFFKTLHCTNSRGRNRWPVSVCARNWISKRTELDIYSALFAELLLLSEEAYISTETANQIAPNIVRCRVAVSKLMYANGGPTDFRDRCFVTSILFLP